MIIYSQQQPLFAKHNMHNKLPTLPPSVDTSVGHNTHNKTASSILHEISVVPLQQGSLSHRHSTTHKLTPNGTTQQHIFLYTQSVPTPKLKDSIKTNRVLLRIAQSLCCIAAFIALGFAAFNVDFPFVVLSESGVNAMVFTCIISFVFILLFHFVNFKKSISISCLFLYTFPAVLGVPPQRYLRFSRIEVAVDCIAILGWYLPIR